MIHNLCDKHPIEYQIGFVVKGKLVDSTCTLCEEERYKEDNQNAQTKTTSNKKNIQLS